MLEIIKEDGTRELFNIHKLADSLVRSGAEPELARAVSEKVGGRIADGSTTSGIFREAYKILRGEERTAAARYSMRRAILELGPTGFPFEDYVAELFKAKGYPVQKRVMVDGKCGRHEVDIVFEREGRSIGAELKFHNQPGEKTDVKVALYVKARFDDIRARTIAGENASAITEGWLITNTKFTDHAISYASCAGVHLLGWGYPDKGNLSDLIRETGVYPITVLTSLSRAEKNALLAASAPLCSSMNQEVLRRAGVSERKINAALEESKRLCGA